MRRAKIATLSITILICIAAANLAFADPTITTNSPLPDALLNTAYNTQINAADGTVFNATVVDGEYGDWPAGSGYYWTISAGALPAGMSLQTTNPNGTEAFEWYDQGYNYYTARLPGQIKIVGSPTQTGVVTFTLTAHCFGGANVSKQFAITVGTNQLNITTASLPPNDINCAYSATVVATGGTTPYSWSITNGSLPAGLSLNSSTGVIAGTPTASGTSNFTVQVTSNDSQTATKALSIYIAPTISITTGASLPGAYIYAPYSTIVNAADGTLVQATVVDGEYGNWSAGSGYRWELAAGNLPPSMALVTNNTSGSAEDWYDQGNNHFSGWLPGQGLLVGSPSATGTYTFTLRTIGYLNRSITKEFTIVVTVTPLSITTNSLPQADPNIAYSTTLHFAGGITPVTWSIINGSLPSGITLDSQTGVIAGTSTEAGTTAYFTVQASSHDGQTITKSLSLHIVPPLTVHTDSVPPAAYNTPYSTVISVTGGTVISATVVDGEYGDWFAGTGYLITLEGTLPPGLGLTSTNGDPCEWYSQSNQHYFSPIAGLPKITGTPTHGGTYTFIITVTDYLGATANKQYTMTLDGPINNGPTNLIVTATSSSQIAFEFLDNSNNEEGFIVERKKEIYGTYETIAYISPISPDTGTGIPILSYDEVLSPDATYYYRVCAYNETGNSPYSNEPNALTWMQAPTNLQATPVSISQINLSWQNNTTNEDGLIIERKAGYGDFAQIATVNPNSTSYSDTNLLSNTRYDYRVKPYRTGNISDYSNITDTVTIRLTVPYLSGIVTQDYNQSLITDYSVYQTLLGYLSSAHSSAGQGDLVSYVSYLNAFNDKVITETGTTINQNAGTVLTQLCGAVKEVKAEMKGEDPHKPAVPYLPEGFPVTFTGIVSPYNAPGTYGWYAIPSDVELIGDTTGQISGGGTITPTIAIRKMSTGTIFIYFVFTSTYETVVSGTHETSVITSTIETFIPTLNNDTKKQLHVKRNIGGGLAGGDFIIMEGMGFWMSGYGSITTDPINADYIAQWKLGFVQNMLSYSLALTYTSGAQTACIKPIYPAGDFPLLDHPGEGVPITHTNSISPFAGANSSAYVVRDDTPITPIGLKGKDDPRVQDAIAYEAIHNPQTDYSWLNDANLTEVKRENHFITWLIAHNTVTTDTIIWLYRVEWTFVQHVAFNAATGKYEVQNDSGITVVGDIETGQGPLSPKLTTKPNGLANDYINKRPNPAGYNVSP